MAETTSTARIRLALDGASAVEQGLASVQERVGGLGQALAGLAGGVTLAGFAMLIKGAIDAGDEMSKLSQKAGLAAKDIAGLQLAAGQSGLDASALQSSLGKLNKAIAESSPAFAAMGLSAKNANGSLKGSREVLGELADKFASYQDGAAKARLAQELFGKAGADMIPLLNGGSSALEEFDKKAQQLGLTLSDETQKAAEQFNDQLDLMRAGSQGLWRQLATQLLPTLNDIAAAMIESRSSSDSLAKILGKGLTIVLQTVAVLANTLVTALRLMGGEVVTIGKQLYALASLDMGKFNQLGDNWTEQAKKIRAASDLFDKKVMGEELNNMGRGQGFTDERLLGSARSIREQTEAWKASAPVIQAAGDAASEAAKQYAELMSKINERIALSNQELAAGRQLNESEKQNIKLQELLTSEKNKLTDAQVKAIGARAKEAEAAELAVTIQRAEIKNIEEIAKARQAIAVKDAESIEKAAQAEYQANVAKIKGISDRITGLQDELEAEKLAITGNMSMAEAIERVTIARLEEKKAMLLEGGTAYEDLQREIDKRRELLGVIADKAKFDEARSMWESVDKTAKSVFVNVFENGSGAFKRLGQTLKAAVLDLLYQMTIKKWIINIGASVTGSTAMAGSGQGVTGFLSSAGNLLGVGDTLAKVYSTVTGGFAALGDSVAFAAQDVGAWLTTNTTGVLNEAGASLMQSSGALGTAASYAGGMLAGYSIGKAISGQYSTSLGKNTLEVAGTTIGAIFGGPIGAAIGGAIGGLVNRAFGMGAKNVTGEGISGNFSASGGADVQSYSTWFQKGGWFRSNKSGTNYAGISTELDDFLDAAIMMTAQATRQYAQLVGLSTDAISGYNKAINISLIGLDQAGREKAIAGAVSGFGEDLAKIVLGEAGKALQRQGETAAAALVRLATALGGVNDVLKSLGQRGLGASLTGASNAQSLLDLFGGMDAYTQAAGQYLQGFYSDAERLALAQTRLRDALAQVGVAMPNTVEAYRRLVEAQDLTTESGQRQYAGLLQLAPAFQEVTQAAQAAAEASQQEARAKIEALRASGKSISEWLVAVRSGASGPAASLSSARSAYLQSLNLARANDESGLSSVTSAADGYLAAARAQASTRSQFNAILAQVSSELSSLPAVKGYQRENLELLKLINDSIGLVGGEQLGALGQVNAAVDTVGDYTSGTELNTTEALKAATRQIEALVFLNNDGLLAVSKNTAASLDYLSAMRDYLKNIDESTAKTAANPVTVNQGGGGGGGIIGSVLSFFGFATGGVFDGQGIYDKPTPFLFGGDKLGVMGEAGPEAVMPLKRMDDGSLGVRALPSYIYAGAGSDSSAQMTALVAEMRALRLQVEELQANTRSTAMTSAKQARLLDRVTQGNDAIMTQQVTP